MKSRELNNFKQVIDNYYEDKLQYSELEKSIKSKNSFIKNKLAELELDDFLTDNCKAKVTYQNKNSMDEDKVIEILKQNLNEYTQSLVIKTKEYVDYEVLEKLIYNGEINASKLEPAQTTKTTVTLKVTKLKREEDYNG
jgi:hypothetical protein